MSQYKRDRIQRLSTKKPEASTPTTIAPFWVTVDQKADGSLEDALQVWIAPPKMFRLQSGAIRWLASTRDYANHYGAYWRKSPPSWVCTIPDEAHQCVRHY